MAQSHGRGWRAAFECGECGLALLSSRQDWVGPVCAVGRRPCGFCGHQWLSRRIRQTEWPREVLTDATQTCPECGHESVVTLETHRSVYASDQIDPHFGLPLSLVDAGRHGALWAYNVRHIATLKAYVAATLRERGSRAGSQSMISCLPAWMKAAKNREDVLKRLVKLEQLLVARLTAPLTSPDTPPATTAQTPSPPAAPWPPGR